MFIQCSFINRFVGIHYRMGIPSSAISCSTVSSCSSKGSLSSGSKLMGHTILSSATLSSSKLMEESALDCKQVFMWRHGATKVRLAIKLMLEAMDHPHVTMSAIACNLVAVFGVVGRVWEHCGDSLLFPDFSSASLAISSLPP